MGCIFCERTNNDFIPLNQTADYSGIEIAINRQGMLRVRYNDVNEPNFITQDIINIKYCPICGNEFIQTDSEVK